MYHSRLTSTRIHIPSMYFGQSLCKESICLWLCCTGNLIVTPVQQPLTASLTRPHTPRPRVFPHVPEHEAMNQCKAMYYKHSSHLQGICTTQFGKPLSNWIVNLFHDVFGSLYSASPHLRSQNWSAHSTQKPSYMIWGGYARRNHSSALPSIYLTRARQLPVEPRLLMASESAARCCNTDVASDRNTAFTLSRTELVLLDKSDDRSTRCKVKPVKLVKTD